MMHTQTGLQVALLILVAGGVSGCGATRDPASEEPVEVTAGMYTIAIDDSAMAALMMQNQGSGGLGETVCIRPGEEAAFPQRVATLFRTHNGCSHMPTPRTGNAFGGAWRCSGNPSMGGAASAIITNYTGSIAPDLLEIVATNELQITAPPGQSAEEAAEDQSMRELVAEGSITVTASRTGDCA